MTTALLADPVYKEHYTGPGHPERPERFDAVVTALQGLPLAHVESRPATIDEITLCHSPRYVQTVQRDVASGYGTLSTGDTTISAGSAEVALRAVGGVLNAVDAVMSRGASNAFCVVRPPGHHATPDRGMGFCIFNNVAIGARYAQKKHGAERVLIVDWDVHHGNGTQDIFYGDGSVLFFSTHQYPWYPGTGAADESGYGEGEGCTINCPFPANTGRDGILAAFRDRLLPAVDEFNPDLVLLSAGFDSRAGDPLGRFYLTDEDFVEMTKLMLDVADRHAGGRLVSVLEGGYSLTGVSSAARCHVETLLQT
ncbi:MAG TPA: histone deacetylase [Bryobacteraceae bacterium]|nr:histone deacetylase [Bryobacteraceae bacterium]